MNPTSRTGVGVRFYERLAAGDLVGEAVQQSRIDMEGNKDRSFATPVLYLQRDSKFVVKEGSGKSSVAHPPVGGVYQSLSDLLKNIDEWYVKDAVQRAEEMISGRDLRTPEEASYMLQRLLKAHADDLDLIAVLSYLKVRLHSAAGGESPGNLPPNQQHAKPSASSFITTR